MDPRFVRPSSPGSRRISQPFRSSTGTLIFPAAYDNYPPPRTSRETIIPNPRASAERVTTRVVPRVEAHQVRRAHDDYHVAPRRMTLEPMDPPPRRPLSVVNTTIPNRYPPILTSSIDPPASPASKSRHREDGPYYIQPASSSSRKDHARHYSVDNTDSLERYMAGDSRGPTRSYAINPGSSTARLVKTETVPREQNLYQRSGQIYTRETDYHRASRDRRSESLSGRRPLSMGGIEAYAASKNSSREPGPPVTTRGFDKLERVASRREEFRPRDAETASTTSSKDSARRSRDESETLNRRSSLREPTLHQDREDGYTSYREDREPRRRHHHHRSRREDSLDRGVGHSAVDLRLEGDGREIEERSKKHRDSIRHKERDDGEDREHRPRRDREETEEREYRPRRERDEIDEREYRSRRVKDESDDKEYRSRKERDDGEKRERRSHKDRDEKPDKHHGSDLALGAAGVAAAGLVAEGVKNHRANSRDERANIEVPVERKSERRRDRDRDRERGQGVDKEAVFSDASGNSGDNEERREKERRRERRREREREREQEREPRKYTDERRDLEDILRPKEEHHRAISFDRGARPNREQLKNAEEPRKSLRSHRHRERREDPSSEDEVSSEEERKAIEPSKPLVRVVSPEREKKEPEAKPKGILKQPRVRFPEDPTNIREGVAPLDKAGKDGVPATARWTKVSRSLVNPEALERGNERYELQGISHVIVLRVLGKDEIQQYAELTQKIRLEREEKMHELRLLEDEERKHARESMAIDNVPYETENPRLALEAPARNPSPYVAEERSNRECEERRDREREREREPAQIQYNPPYPTSNSDYASNPNPSYPAQGQPHPLPYNAEDPYDPYLAQNQPAAPSYNPYQPTQPLQQPYPLPTHQQPDPYAPQQQIPGSFPPPPVPQGPYAPQLNGATSVPPVQQPYGQPNEYGRSGPPAGHF